MFDKKLANQKKNEIQDIAIKGSKGYLRMLLSWATGCGKSLGALKILREDYMDNPDIKGYLICSESNHLDNWIEDIKHHKMEFIHKCSEQFLYASLHKYSPKGFVDFVILDEVHHLTDKRLQHLRLIIGPKTRLVMLSATVDIEKEFILKKLARPYGEYNIDISKAIDMGILPTPTIYIHKFELDDIIKDKTLELKRDFKPHFIRNLTELESYDTITAEMDMYLTMYESEDGKPWMRNIAVNLGNKRKRMLAEFKTERAKKLLKDKFTGFRYITFTGSKAQAELLGRNYIHSGMSKKRNIELKNKFNRKRLTSLTVVNMFREGMNLINIEKGLIVQLDNVKLSFIQMLGRVFRSAIPEMHIMVFRDTQDEKYLNNVLYGFNNEYVKYIDYEKI